MGINDRDYARANENRWGAGGGGGANRGGGSGRRESSWFDPRTWTMTGWLVGLNIFIAVVGAVLLALPNGRGWVAVPTSIRWAEGVTEEMKSPAWVDEQADKNVRVTRGAPIKNKFGQVIGVQLYSQMSYDQAWGHFSTAKAFGQMEVWRFVTFQFLHTVGWLHLALNLIGLWTFGPDVEEYLGRKRYLALYLVCGVFGALAYLLLNALGNIFPGVKIPGLLFNDPRTPLVGASAGIFGIMLAAAFVVPQRVIDILFIIPIRIKPAVYLFFGISVISLFLGSSNAGGEAAHVGGAVAGYYFIRHMYHLRDFFDVFGPSKKPGAARLNQAEVDRVLAKLHQHGEAALDDEERETLKQATAAANAATKPSSPSPRGGAAR